MHFIKVQDEIKEHFAKESEARLYVTRLQAKQDIPFRGRLVDANYYMENTQAKHRWCVRYTVEREVRV